ncbi:NlpC/P60 family protein [Williamsia maris]|uniref:Cell wall-associated hydrolase, NlpC family n=1 Tax=Williamsia maris TaxID=72806 RepID=A0ABT1HK87_9NOCA|nr:NlpC/P60 family protein [Williamsia maris]MCP2178304.1 Cell wall-associated hydrolase, NlpC family [Williamsia maris]
MTAVATMALVVIIALLGMGVGPSVAAPSAGDSPRSPGGIADLINQIAGTDQHLADLDNTVALKRESVNRTLVDLQNARDQERLASIAMKGSQDALGKATAAISTAQRGFDDFVRNLYRQGSSQSSMTNYLSTSDPSAVLDRAGILDRLTKKQKASITQLKVARNEQANRVATAAATRAQASFATKSAAARKNDALQAIQDAMAAVRTESARRVELTAARDQAQAQLDALRGRAAAAAAAAVPGQVQASAPTQAPAAGAPAAQAPAGQVPAAAPVIPGRVPAAAPVNPMQNAIQTAAQSALKVAAEAAAKLAVDAAQQVLASVVASIQRPHTDLNGTDQGTAATPGTGGSTSVTPGVTGSAAVEIVVNRALSQLGVTYAWGGGNANGPTKGIRDGGVADSYGDYNKSGFDCSGLMIYAFAGIGISLPHYTGYQYTSGKKVPLSQMQRGDMIFYGPNASEHVALVLGNNQMVEAPQSGDVVKISPLRTSGAMPYVIRLTG